MAGDNLKWLAEELRGLAAWPHEGYDRRTDDGYPMEAVYDEFAYKRLVDSYREALRGLADRAEITAQSEGALVA